MGRSRCRVLGGGLLIWTLRTLGANLTDTVITRKEHTLVTSGPYPGFPIRSMTRVGLAKG